MSPPSWCGTAKKWLTCESAEELSTWKIFSSRLTILSEIFAGLLLCKTNSFHYNTIIICKYWKLTRPRVQRPRYRVEQREGPFELPCMCKSQEDCNRLIWNRSLRSIVVRENFSHKEFIKIWSRINILSPCSPWWPWSPWCLSSTCPLTPPSPQRARRDAEQDRRNNRSPETHDHDDFSQLECTLKNNEECYILITLPLLLTVPHRHDPWNRWFSISSNSSYPGQPTLQT